jgi:hypothetical protein
MTEKVVIGNAELWHGDALEVTGGGYFRNDRPSYAQMAAFTAAQTDAFGHADEEAIACFCGD